ncbi:cytochrome P450 family protein [Saccharopolyspora pogona]|uniref:cytochrome P450 family protein n=1 Tax=Saccharopolyspora pogona TaxID=333966 RepID=UPI0016835A71|nr:cytochrome P450 [Saccharopolyspora pogona]
MNDEPVKLLSRSFMQDPYPTLESLRRDHAAIPVENGGFRMWVITRYDDAHALLADPTLQRDLVKHRHAVVEQNLVDIERRPKLPRELRRSMLDQDGADHRRMRGIVAKFFTPSRLAALRPGIERLADDLLDGLPVGEPVDIVDQYARPLSATCLSEMLGVPEDARDRFPLWETAILTAPSKEEVEDAGRQLQVFAGEIIALKREQPRADLFTELVRAGAAGLLDDAELVSMITLLLIAGLEPTSAIGSGVLVLLRHSEELARLRADPDLITACVEEILRFETPFRMLTPRYVDHPLELDGVTIPAGELLLISTGSANRDPSRFADPDRFDITRDTKGHLGFSHGRHRCMGAELGRIETAVGLGRLFDRFPATALAVAPQDVQWRPGMFMRRVDSLPVVLG